MFDHPRIAVIAADLMPAGAAQGHRRIAAAVDEQHRLLAPFQPLVDLDLQRGRHPFIARQAFAAHVDRAHRRHHRRPKARCQLDPRIFARLGVGPAFQRRSGRGQNHLRPADRRPQHGHVTGVIQHAFFLLVRGVMFLVDDDQTKVLERQKQRRPRTDHHLSLSLSDHFPDATPLCHRGTRVPFRRLCAKPRLHTVQELFGQRDFRQQHQSLPAGFQRSGDGLQIDFGLARSGHPPQQGGAICARGHPRRQQRRGRGLILRQLFAGQAGVHAHERQIARAVLFQHCALGHQPLDHRRRHPRHLGQFLERERKVAILRQSFQHATPRVGHPVRLPLAAPVNLAHRRRVAQPRRTRRQPQHRGHRRQRIGGGTGQKTAQFFAHGGRIEHADHRPYPGQIVIPLPSAPDDTDHLARTQRHLDEGPHMAAAFGRFVIQRTAQRLGGHHGHQLTCMKKFWRFHQSLRNGVTGIRVPAWRMMR